MSPDAAQVIDAHALRARRILDGDGPRIVAIADSWEAHLRDLADMVGVTIGDVDQARRVVAGAMIVQSLAAQMFRQRAMTEDELGAVCKATELTAALAAAWIPGCRS